MSNIVVAIFDDKKTAETEKVWQYSYGQILRVQGLKLPTAVEIHFSTTEKGGQSVTRIGVTKDAITDVIIPDTFLENKKTSSNYYIYAFIYLRDNVSGQTEYKIKLPVLSRPEPEAFDIPGEGELFQQAIEAVNEAAKRASDCEKKAEGWAHGRTDLPEREQDNAKYYAGKAALDAKQTALDRAEVEKMVDSVAGIDEQVTKVEQLSKQAQESATQAGASAEVAEQAKAQAETAKAGAETAAGKTAEDRIAVDQARTAVEESQRAVKADRTAVEEVKQSVEQLGNAIPEATQAGVQAVNQAKQTAVYEITRTGTSHKEAVEAAGTTAVQNVSNSKADALQAVETAKTEVVQAVQTEGTKQVKAVTDTGTQQTQAVTAEGQKQLTAVQQAAQEIVADREQIEKNKTGIKSLKQCKADAIVETASGTLINIKDSADTHLIKLKIDKNVDWIKITGKNLLDAQGDKHGKFIENMTFGTGSIKYMLKDNYGGAYVTYSKIFEPGKYVITAKITKNGGNVSGFRCGFDKNISIKNNNLIYNKYYEKYFMRNYAKKVEIISSEPFCVMFSIAAEDGIPNDVVEFTEIQIEKGEVATSYEPYCVEQKITSPVTEEKISTLHTNYPTTIICNSKDAHMEVSYVADTKLYIDQKLEQLVKASQKETANLLSLMPMETQAAMIENDTNRILESEVT